jgi:hypothetical protein
MIWPFKRAPRPPERFNAPQIQFAGEQDGPTERQLKANWIPILAAERAYLARVAYDDPQGEHGALAIHSASGQDDRLETALGNCFVRTFRQDVYLDIIFISPAQEVELSLRCPPFYESGQSPTTILRPSCYHVVKLIHRMRDRL